jgi:hypothetical protein
MASTKHYRMITHEPGDLLTVAEFAPLPEDKDGWRSELIRGVAPGTRSGCRNCQPVAGHCPRNAGARGDVAGGRDTTGVEHLAG